VTSALEPLRRLAAGRRPLGAPEARCHLCGGELPEAHRHVVERRQRTMACACAACAVLGEDGRGPWATIPTRVLAIPSGLLDEPTWASLAIPVRLAFIFFSSGVDRWTVLYPSPAGAAEAAVDVDGLQQIAPVAALVRAMEPDVEALLIRGRTGGGFALYLAPIDACYRLVGRVRKHWQGFQGGDRAWREIDSFFAELDATATAFAPDDDAPEAA
jgi:hypothetical protein